MARRLFGTVGAIPKGSAVLFRRGGAESVEQRALVHGPDVEFEVIHHGRQQQGRQGRDDAGGREWTDLRLRGGPACLYPMR